MKIILTSIVILLVTGCSKDHSDFSGTPEPNVKYLQSSDIFRSSNCFMPSDLKNCNGFIITDQSTYEQFSYSSRIYSNNPNIECDTATLAPIDFNKYSLLSVLTTCGVCDSVSRSVLVNQNAKKISYNINITSNLPCIKLLLISYNFALIPKIPDGYQVVFNVKCQ